MIRRQTRAGFTLVELLVVIAIIAVLVSLTAAGVQRARIAADRHADGTDIRKIAEAVGNFPTKLKAEYIPSRLKICERWSDYPTGSSATQLDIDSQNWMLTCWPQLDRTTSAGTGTFTDWNGDGTYTGPVTLEGPEVLVFALGGIGGTQGFSQDTRNPARPTAGETRIGPFVEFKAARLTRLPNTQGGQAGYQVYLNPWGNKAQPYAYFSNYGKPNGYNRYGSSDCASLGLSPYTSASGKYWNEGSFQIISAGRDGLFGPGGVWPTGGLATAAEDDMANFARGVLAAGPD